MTSKKITRTEKRLSKKLQHDQQRHIVSEEKVDEKRKILREKQKGKKTLKSKPARGSTVAWKVQTKGKMITANNVNKKPKTFEHENTYDQYSDLVRKKSKKVKVKKHESCQECMDRCKTGACRSWCGVRWCSHADRPRRTFKTVTGKVVHMKHKLPSVKSLVCTKCAGASGALKAWCDENGC